MYCTHQHPQDFVETTFLRPWTSPDPLILNKAHLISTPYYACAVVASKESHSCPVVGVCPERWSLPFFEVFGTSVGLFHRPKDSQTTDQQEKQWRNSFPPLRPQYFSQLLKSSRTLLPTSPKLDQWLSILGFAKLGLHWWVYRLGFCLIFYLSLIGPFLFYQFITISGNYFYYSKTLLCATFAVSSFRSTF